VHELGRDHPKTTKELFDITTQHASGEEAIRAVFIQGNGKAVPVDSQGSPRKTASKGAKRSTKGSKRGPKWRPQWIAVTTSYDEGDNNKEADDSDEEHVTATKHDFKRQARQPTNHFEKFLKATYPNHAYPARHNIKEWSVMKHYTTMGDLTKGKKPEGDVVGKATTPFPGEEEAMPIYGGPTPHESRHKLKLMSWTVNTVSLATPEYLHWSESLMTFD
jgi:hypothetical protein